LFLIPSLLFKHHKKGIFEVLKRFFPSAFRSSAFLATLASCVLPISCAIRGIFGKFHPFLVFLGGVIGGALSILIERKDRRRELAVFTMNQSVEAVYKMGVSRDIFPIFDKGDVFVFMVASSLLSYFYTQENECLGNIKAMLGFLLGDKSNEVNAEKPTGTLCKHKESCWSFTLRGFFRGFMIGCGLRGTLTFLSLLFLKKMYRNPKKLLELSFGSKTTNFGLFLGFFVGCWKGIACLLRNIRVRDDEINSIVAGAVAGLSILFSRSTEISMYCLSKGVEAIFVSMTKKGVMKPLPHPDVFMFAIGTGIIFYCCSLEPYNLRPSYWRFMRSVSGGRFDQFEMIAKVHRSIGFLQSGFKYPQGITSNQE